MRSHTKKNTLIGDAAVDGLLAGLGAGVVMVVYLILTGLIAGEGLGEILARFSPGETASPLVGTLSHLAVSAIYGTVFGVVSLPLKHRVPGWLSGLVFGMGLFLVAWFALLPGAGSPLIHLSPWRFGIAHLLYGAVLGYLLGRKL